MLILNARAGLSVTHKQIRARYGAGALIQVSPFPLPNGFASFTYGTEDRTFGFQYDGRTDELLCARVSERAPTTAEE